jgi:divalent metal cation (Fe/Co/Zn/Cd) transporter
LERSQPSAGRWLRIGLWLVVATLAYNLVEAVIALWSGWMADSIALIGFGFDSLIELAAASLLLWRLAIEARGADLETIERTEHRVHRFVGVTFLLLALYVTVQAVATLWTARAPKESLIGIVLAATRRSRWCRGS